MKCFSRKKLIKGLKKYTDINEAEEYVRSYPISLIDKIQILNENEKLNELRESKANYSPFQIKKVNWYFYLSLARIDVKILKNVFSFFDSQRFKSLKRFLKSIKYLFLTVFQSRINSIEKNLGLDVVSYFIYSKWLFYHNFVSLILIILPFVFIPHIISIKDQLEKLDMNKSSKATCLTDDNIKSFKPLDIFIADVSICIG